MSTVKMQTMQTIADEVLRLLNSGEARATAAKMPRTLDVGYLLGSDDADELFEVARNFVSHVPQGAKLKAHPRGYDLDHCKAEHAGNGVAVLAHPELRSVWITAEVCA